MKKIILSALLLLGCAAIGTYFWQQGKTPETRPEAQSGAAEMALPAPAPNPPEAAVAALPETSHYPVDASLQAAPAKLPALDASDPAIQDALTALLGKMPIQQLLQPQEIVRRIVVTIDNLTRFNAAARLLPTRPVHGKFLTEGPPGNRTIAPENAARYHPYALLAKSTDAKKLVSLYAHNYAWFQRAYQDLGYPDAYFNDRLIAVIDHLLAAPEPAEPLALIQPHVLFEFADPALEARSAGHKVLLRMGSANAARVKAKLRDIRAALIEKMPAQAPLHR